MVLIPVGKFGCFKGIRVVEEPIGDMATNRSFFVDIPIHEGRDSSVKKPSKIILTSTWNNVFLFTIEGELEAREGI